MPLYEYACDGCGSRFERIQKFSDPPVAECPSCGGPVRKLISSPAIQFKGSGWYITDYAKSSENKPAKDGSTKDGGAEKTDTATSDAAKSDAPAKSAGTAAPASPASAPAGGSTKS